MIEEGWHKLRITRLETRQEQAGKFYEATITSSSGSFVELLQSSPVFDRMIESIYTAVDEYNLPDSLELEFMGKVLTSHGEHYLDEVMSCDEYESSSKLTCPMYANCQASYKIGPSVATTLFQIRLK